MASQQTQVIMEDEHDGQQDDDDQAQDAEPNSLLDILKTEKPRIMESLHYLEAWPLHVLTNGIEANASWETFTLRAKCLTCNPQNQEQVAHLKLPATAWHTWPVKVTMCAFVCRSCGHSSGGNFETGWAHWLLKNNYGEYQTGHKTKFVRPMVVKQYEPSPMPPRYPLFDGKPGTWFAVVEWEQDAERIEQVWVDNQRRMLMRGGRVVWDGTPLAQFEKLIADEGMTGPFVVD
jgi:hypothetical protein